MHPSKKVLTELLIIYYVSRVPFPIGNQGVTVTNQYNLLRSKTRQRQQAREQYRVLQYHVNSTIGTVAHSFALYSTAMTKSVLAVSIPKLSLSLKVWTTIYYLTTICMLMDGIKFIYISLYQNNSLLSALFWAHVLINSQGRDEWSITLQTTKI